MIACVKQQTAVMALLPSGTWAVVWGWGGQAGSLAARGPALRGARSSFRTEGSARVRIEHPASLLRSWEGHQGHGAGSHGADEHLPPASCSPSLYQHFPPHFPLSCCCRHSSGGYSGSDEPLQADPARGAGSRAGTEENRRAWCPAFRNVLRASSSVLQSGAGGPQGGVRGVSVAEVQ